DFHHPHQLLDGIEGFSLEITGEAESLEQILVDCRDTLKYGVKTGHPRFFNQLSSGLDIISLAADWLTSTANTNMFTYEIAPVFTLMEDVVIRRMCSIIGWEDGEGIFSPGGSINNLYAVIMARHYVMPEVKYDGMRGFPELVMFQSKHILQSKLAGKVPFYVTATAGTTVIGAFDKIPEISGICKKYGVWLHVDAAWGGAVMMSQKHRHLVTGIELADSVTWNPHKMMGVVLQCSALLTRHKVLVTAVMYDVINLLPIVMSCLVLSRHSDVRNTSQGILESCNEMNADYLFQQDKHYDVTYDTGDKTIQCGRHVDVFKLWLAWRAKGDAGFEKHVDRCIELSRYLVRKIRKTRGFELVNPEPEYANVCFWYFPPCIRNLSDETIKHEKLNKVAPLIKSRMMENGTIMIGYQPLGSKVNFFRNIVSNPAVDYDDIDFIITEIERLGRDI
uniref:Glutamate decarboxylase n=1 Tax=Ciona savignyi TaxID=51511 RepID=H2ZAN1_CIOSA